jgi:hypothetical protein
MLSDESTATDKAGNSKPVLAVGFSRVDSGPPVSRDNIAAPIYPEAGLELPEVSSENVMLTNLPLIGQDDVFGTTAMLQMQDFTWFDSLPTDLLAINDAELFSQPLWEPS